MGNLQRQRTKVGWSAKDTPIPFLLPLREDLPTVPLKLDVDGL